MRFQFSKNQISKVVLSYGNLEVAELVLYLSCSFRGNVDGVRWLGEVGGGGRGITELHFFTHV